MGILTVNFLNGVKQFSMEKIEVNEKNNVITAVSGFQNR